ncbi:hypothetical protein M902_1214 [Bacteriovorax sp. BAL6_X]|nr:hypothetical protein [Bacteriovorax sp. BAL6_X]EPZ49508.1 hypothetical protein M902_1214 [Bacteriovorax sp. BAL6_X]
MMINNCYRLLCEITKLEKKLEEIQAVAKSHGVEIDANEILEDLIKAQAS